MGARSSREEDRAEQQARVMAGRWRHDNPFEEGDGDVNPFSVCLTDLPMTPTIDHAFTGRPVSNSFSGILTIVVHASSL